MNDMIENLQRFETSVLDGLDQGDRSAQKFKQLIGGINNALITTHQIVIIRLDAVAAADSANEVRVLLEGLRVDQLEEAFRVEGMCDLLGGLGEALARRASDAQGEGYFNSGDLSQVYAFAERLAQREHEVAELYASELQDLILASVDDRNLDEIRNRAAEVSRRLTDQIADFQAKVQRFTRLAPT